MMLRDGIEDAARQAAFAAQFQAVAHVAHDDRRAFAWVEGVVDVLHATLVVNEGGGANDLADIVVVGGYTGEEGVGADHFGGALGEIADDQGVVVCAGGLAHEAAKNGLVGVCQLHELHGGGDTKNSAQE